jgi:hypothetical protein
MVQHEARVGLVDMPAEELADGSSPGDFPLEHIPIPDEIPRGFRGEVESFLRAPELLLGPSLRGDVAGEATGVDEAAVFAVDAGVDEHIPDGPVLALETRRVVVQNLVGVEPAEQIGNGRLIRMELADVVPDVLLAPVAHELELGLVGAQDRPVGADPVHRHGPVVERILQLALQSLGRGQRRPEPRQLLGWRLVELGANRVEGSDIGAHGGRNLGSGTDGTDRWVRRR